MHVPFVQQNDSYRINPKFKTDCVVRSISNATGRPYQLVFEELMKLGLEMVCFPNMDIVYHEYLKRLGWNKNKCPRDSKGKLIKLKDWKDRPETAVIKNSGHLTSIVDGVCYDTWDCTYRPVNTYWTPPTPIVEDLSQEFIDSVGVPQ